MIGWLEEKLLRDLQRKMELASHKLALGIICELSRAHQRQDINQAMASETRPISRLYGD
jgi:hypothetical protein